MKNEALLRYPSAAAGRRPDFIGLGVAKCGTTWVYDMLSQHPQIALGRAERKIDFCYKTEHALRLRKEDGFQIKEIQFWNNLYRPFDQKKAYLEAYKALFAGAGTGQIAGEITNNYLFFLLDDNVFKTFCKSLPESKLFVCLRNPIDRFISNHFWQNDIGRIHREMGIADGYYSRGKFPGLSEDIETIVEWLKAPGPKNPQHPVSVRQFVMGLYPMQIRNVLTGFKPEQLHIILYDDIRDRPEETLSRLCSFLGIDAGFEFEEASKPSNITRTPKHFRPEERNALVHLYRQSIVETAELLGRDLSHWK